MSRRRFLYGFLMAFCATVSCYPRPAYEFIVDTGDDQKATAVLELCGSSSRLRRSGRVLVAHRLFGCEGDGWIEVRSAAGVTECPIGYVTTGPSTMHWRFELRGDDCVLIESGFEGRDHEAPDKPRA